MDFLNKYRDRLDYFADRGMEQKLDRICVMLEVLADRQNDQHDQPKNQEWWWRWHTMDDIPPMETENCSIDVIIKTGNKVSIGYYNKGVEIWVANGFSVESYSRWMPIPPKEK